MTLRVYKAVMRAADLTLRTFGNRDNSPVINMDISAHCDFVNIRFYKDGWKPDTQPTYNMDFCFEWGDRKADALNRQLDIIEGEIRAWEALNKKEEDGADE